MCTNPINCNLLDKNLFKFTHISQRLKRFYRGEKEFLENYLDVFNLTGGEPTLNPDFFKIIAEICNIFGKPKINCLTNGRLFAYPGFAEKFFQLSQPVELGIALHGHNSQIHDKITQTKKSFEQTIEGLKNIFKFRRKKQIVEIRVIIHKLNYMYLNEIFEFIKHTFPHIDRLVYVFFEIEGHAKKNAELIKISHPQVAPYINMIYHSLFFFPDTRLYHFPLCTLPAKFYPYVWRTLAKHETTFLNKCYQCVIKKVCLGIHKNYLKYFGDEDFSPIAKTDFLIIQNKNNWHHPIKKIKFANVN